MPLDESSESTYKEIISASNICYSLSLFLSYTIYLCSCRRSSLAPFLSARTVSTSTFDLREDVLLSLNCNLPEALAKTFPCPTHIFFFIFSLQKNCVVTRGISIKCKLPGNGTVSASLILTEQSNF